MRTCLTLFRVENRSYIALTGLISPALEWRNCLEALIQFPGQATVFQRKQGWITAPVYQAECVRPQHWSRFHSLPTALLKSLFRKGWRWNVLTGLLCVSTRKFLSKKSIFIITSYQRLARTRLGTECARISSTLLCRERACSTSFHEQSLGRARFWVSRTCALPSTATITLASPFNCSQLKLPHLQEMEIIMPSCLSQDFSDYKWQKLKSYFRKIKKIIYWKTMGEAQRLQTTAGFRS